MWDNRSAPGGAVNTIRGLTRSSDLTREGLAMKATRTCSVQDCELPVFGRGLCAKHHARLRRYGSPTGKPASRKADLTGRRFGLLTVVAPADQRHWHCRCDCGAATVSRHWSLLNGLASSCAAGFHQHAESVGYVSAHKRIRSARGVARDYSCIDCGGAAQQWSYDYTDPNVLFARPGGHYSLDVSRYDPRCALCHKRFDIAARSLGCQCRECIEVAR